MESVSNNVHDGGSHTVDKICDNVNKNGYECENNDDSDDDNIIFSSKNRSRKINKVVDSDGDSNSSETFSKNTNTDTFKTNSHDSDSDKSSLSSHSKNRIRNKKRIVKQIDSDSEDSSNENKLDVSSSHEVSNHSNSDNDNAETLFPLSKRIKEKRNKFDAKFKSLQFKKTKPSQKKEPVEKEAPVHDESDSESKVKKTGISNLYDSESSEEDSIVNKSVDRRSSDESRSPIIKTKILSEKHDKPKVQKMSAKQAMEQMQKIKSESSRMLREKEVFLPYHKPRQLSLKDVMAKKNINLTLGNKKTGFKMNQDQLKEYAKKLEEREKEIVELCRSESESDEENDTTDHTGAKENVTLEEDKQEDPKTEVADAAADVRKNLLYLFNDGDKKENEKNLENASDSKKNTQVETVEEKHSEDIDHEMEDLQEKNTSHEKVESNVEPRKDDDTGTVPVFESEVLFEDSDMETDNISQIVLQDNECATSLTQPTEENLPSNNEDLLLFEIETEDHAMTKHRDFKSATQNYDLERPSTSSQQISSSVPIQNLKPKLTGSPGCFINLLSGEVQSGVELLKKKFLIHAAMKTPEELERERERKIQPGASLSKLKRELEEKMIDHRTQEWNKRLEELALKKQEEKDELSDCEELLEKEIEKDTCEDNNDANKPKNEDDDSESGESDVDEELEDDVVIKDKPRSKCDLLNEEAEEEDDDDNNAESDGENDDEDSSSSSESDEEIAKDDSQVKKALSRIIKPSNDSDTSDDELQTDSVPMLEYNKELELRTPSKNEASLKRTYTSNMFESQDHLKSSLDWDDLPLGQQMATPSTTPSESTTSYTESIVSRGRSDLACLVSPVIKLTAMRTISSDNDLEELKSICSLSSGDFRKPTDINKLIMSDDTQYTQGEEDLSQNTENELLQLCTGKFLGLDEAKSQEYENTTSSVSPICHSMMKFKNDNKKEKLMNLKKNLLFESDGSQNSSQDMSELEALCSGKFPSQTNMDGFKKPSDLNKLISDDSQCKQNEEMSQDTEHELLQLCTGKFVGLNDTATISHTATTVLVNDSQNISLELSETENTEKFLQRLSELSPVKTTNLVSDQSSDLIPVQKELNSIVNESNEKKLTHDIIPKNKLKEKSITTFFQAGKKNAVETETAKEMEKKQEDTNIDTLPVNVSNCGGKFVIMSSSEDDEPKENGEGSAKNKILKTKKERSKKFKKKRLQLQISDDETYSDDNNVSDKSLADDNDDDDKLVDYDSEENEIEVQTEIVEVIKKKKQAASEFFDGEAELTSEDEWRGSGDEDERGLDRLEWEEGDADHFDQRKVKKQLEKIHLQTILDDDKREVRLLQEMLLEDDLEGGTRERKFRWKNMDGSNIEIGESLGDDDIDGGVIDEIQSEEQWRKQRHERETFLRQMMEKENSIEFSQNSQGSQSTVKMISRTSIIKSSLVSKSPSSNGHLQTDNMKNTSGTVANDSTTGIEKNKKITKDIPSPVKKPFSLMKNNVRGSFLSGGQAALNRLAMLTRNGPQPQDSEEPTNLSSLAPGKKKNFVFATVSPPCNNDKLHEAEKMAKRKASSDVSTPLLIKKIKINEGCVIKKSKKSLIDHMD